MRSDLWDDEVLGEVVRFRRFEDKNGGDALNTTREVEAKAETTGEEVGRKTLAGMSSKASCPRARKASEQRGPSPSPFLFCGVRGRRRVCIYCRFCRLWSMVTSQEMMMKYREEGEEAGRRFTDGKKDG